MISDSLKKELISAGNTFLATFIGTIGAMLSAGSIEWTWAFWAALAIAGLRAGIKAVTAYFVSTRLGGKKE